MARIRTIKPDFWSDGRMATISRDARLFYIGTWNFACDGGHLPDDAFALRLQIFPGDTDVDPVRLVNELLVSRRLERRESSGRTYLAIPRFKDHQRVDARWASRCPYCRAEAEGPVNVVPLEASQNLSEPRADSREPVGVSASLREAPGVSDGVARGSARYDEARRSSGVEWSGEVQPPPSETASNGSAPRRPNSAVGVFMALLKCTQNEAIALNRRMREEISPIKSAPGMAQYLVENGTAAEWLRAAQKRDVEAAIDLEDRRIRAGAPACEHGVMGGGYLNRVSGKARCPDCQSVAVDRE